MKDITLTILDEDILYVDDAGMVHLTESAHKQIGKKELGGVRFGHENINGWFSGIVIASDC